MEFDKWADNTRKIVFLKLALNNLEKKGKITKKQKKEIELKLKRFDYYTFLNSPHFEGKEELRRKGMELCYEDWKKATHKNKIKKESKNAN